MQLGKLLLSLSILLSFSAQAQYRAHRAPWVKLINETNYTSNTSTYVGQSSVRYELGDLFVLFVLTSDTASLVHTHSITSGHTGMTWTQQTNKLFNTTASPTERISVWTATATSTSVGTYTNTTSDAATGCIMILLQVRQAASTSPVAQFLATTGTGADPSITFSALNKPSHSLELVGVGTASNGNSATVNAGWNSIELSDQGYNTPASGLAVYACMRASDLSAIVTRSASEWGLVALEIKAP